MHILFVYPDVLPGFNNWTGYYYPGIGYLASSLKTAGMRVSLLHITKAINYEEYQTKLNELQPDIVAFSATSLMFGLTKKMANWTKTWQDIMVICGGIHPTIAPNEVTDEKSFDALCIGEGEEALLEFCDLVEHGKDFSATRNFWVRTAKGIKKNELRPLICNLDQLPFPDRSIFYLSNHQERNGISRIMASRGCPYQCTYCCNHVKMQMYKNEKYVRFRTVDNVIAEINLIRKQYPQIKSLWFDDDILPLNIEWFREFAHKYKDLNLPYECQTRPDLMTEEVAKLLFESGCFRIDMGIENGNQDIRMHVMKRNISNEQIMNAFRLCHKYGIQSNSLNIIGVPGEKFENALETIKLNATVYPARCSLYAFYPFKGSKLYDVCKEQGISTERQETSMISGQIDSGTDNLKNYQIYFIKKNFDRIVHIYSSIYKKKGILKAFLEKLLDSFLHSRFLKNYSNWDYKKNKKTSDASF